jgi:hypothetical protein
MYLTTQAKVLGGSDIDTASVQYHNSLDTIASGHYSLDNELLLSELKCFTEWENQERAAVFVKNR